MDDPRDWLALALVPGMGSVRTEALLRALGSPGAVRRATFDELRAVPGIGPKLAGDFRSALSRVDVEAELGRMREHGVSALRRDGADYPEPLRHIPDAPRLLFARGSLTAADDNAVAIIGSRRCTRYGRRTAYRIGHGLAAAGFTVVSGLALGIDGEAHKGALDAGGRTVGVLANGLAKIYPPSHEELGRRVIGSGALISESPTLVAPEAGLFHARNRLISGLSRAVVVVEANARSGTMITVKHAAEQGRQVFAVPGEADSDASAGTLQLIRDGACMVRSAADVIEDLEGVPPPTMYPVEEAPALVESPPAPALTGDERVIWDLLAEPRYADELARESGKSVSEVSMTLFQMEMGGKIHKLSGNKYERV